MVTPSGGQPEGQALLDLCPKGRDEAGLEWSMAWLRRHDAYGRAQYDEAIAVLVAAHPEMRTGYSVRRMSAGWRRLARRAGQAAIRLVAMSTTGIRTTISVSLSGDA